MQAGQRIIHAILDRDGVINEEAPGGYVLSPEHWTWLPGALEALAILVKAGIEISIATNQSCVGRGLIDEARLQQIHGKMKKEASELGVRFAGIHYCPHAPGQGCSCRKPLPGLLEEAIRKSGIPRSQTIFIGDSAKDLQAAAAAGIDSILVRTGHGPTTEADLKKGAITGIAPERIAVFDDLFTASRVLIKEQE
ncbi:MAG: D-glycero-alpha-D-manno-heptose-1,7-bisphosphate 7-phosphatase [Desulfobacterales bacterium]